jgi:cystathionine beta-lyase/cystathionine gamma-synthase
MSSERFPPGEPSAPPLWITSAWTSAGSPADERHAYGRMSNPTWEELEAELGRLERAEARVFASGQAASLALLLALERRRVLVAGDGYYGFRRLLAMLGPLGFETVRVDLADPGEVERELGASPAAILWAETPTNPFLRVFDLALLAELARAAGAPLVVDNTTATAALQRPLDFGADATLTSLTKGTSGHSDVVLGSLATRDAALLERAAAWRQAGGGIAGPTEAWLALRGVRTLELRARRQSESALAVARALLGQARVRAVHYPGTCRETLALAERQMPHGFGALLAFEYDGDAAATEALIRRSRCFRPATSFGGTQSSWERRARWASESAPENLVRVSVGIEDPSVLIEDLERALGG